MSQTTMTGDELRALSDQSPLVRELARQLSQVAFPSLPAWEYEHFFALPRRFRFDIAWPYLKIAVEIDGGIFTRGRHQRLSGVRSDTEKLNLAAQAGWTVLRFSRLETLGGRVTSKRQVKGCLRGACSDMCERRQWATCEQRGTITLRERKWVEATACATIARVVRQAMNDHSRREEEAENDYVVRLEAVEG